MKKTLIIILLFFTINATAQNLGQLIDSIYNFSPQELTKEEQKEKFPKLDTFFRLVMADTSKYIPLLRSELTNNEHMPYFYYDGAHLLMMINQNNLKDNSLIINSFKKADIKDLNPKIYTSLITQLSMQGANTSDLAIEILKDSTFSFYVPQHALKFNQGYCLSYILLPLDKHLYTSKLIANFDTLSETSKKSIITTLWFSYSCEGDEFLNSIKDNNKYSTNVRDYCLNLLSRQKVDHETVKLMRQFYGKDLEKIWAGSFLRFTDEAIGNIDYVTRMRRENEKCR